MAYNNQLILNEIIINLEAENAKIKEHNKILARRICELQSDLADAKVQIHNLKACYNCKAENCETCNNNNNWQFVGG